MKNQVSIVANSRPVHLVEPVFDGNDICELCMTQIVAWRVEYSLEGEDSSATPVTVNYALPSTYAVYDSDTNQWTTPEDTVGEGLDLLLEHFKKTRF